MTGYPTNSSLVANYATKAELQNVDNNHPTNASVNATYIKKVDLAGELSDYATNSSISENYVTKNYADNTFITDGDLDNALDLNLANYATNSSVSENYLSLLEANNNYVSYENIDEIIFNTIDNNYDVHWKVNEIVNDSSIVTDISTHVADVSNKIINVSTRLGTDYLTAQTINQDFVKNASLNDYALNSSLTANYTTKTEFNEVWTTFVTAE